jgi:serine protease Do
MNTRSKGFASLLAVIGVSIVFGMILGGRLNAPAVSYAAPSIALAAAKPPVEARGMQSFADIAEMAMPAVVSVRSANLPGKDKEEEGGEGEQEQQPPRPRGQQNPHNFPGPEEWFRYWFGDPSPEDPRRPQSEPWIGEGSGFVIAEDGYLLTNNHVIDQADDIKVRLHDGREFTAKVVGTDPSIDLALLKINTKGEKLPTLPLGDSSEVRVGEWVLAIGNPQELTQTVTVGVVSAKDRRVPIGNTDQGVVSFIQTDAAINFGNSGGPLLDIRGNVIGINTAIRRMNLAEGIGFALPIDHARRVIDQLREYGHVQRGYIGITMNQGGLDETAQEWLGLPDRNGVIVDDVTRDGPAASAGVHKGDVIRKVNDEMVRDNPDLISKISTHRPGDAVRLEIYRKDGERAKTLTVTAKLGDREKGLQENTQQPSVQPTIEEPSDEPPVASSLGITVKTPTTSDRRRLHLGTADHGVLVTDVEFNSLAQEKGIQANMMIASLNGETVESVEDWERVTKRLRPGAPVKIDVLAPQGRIVSFFLRVPSED